ncbi:hypothetical protein E5D08_26040 [Klebsiella pneumoniae]|uniref:hypothetical protein n=1 Tax=Enterobacteriaceae TaxID=543 RepID=UPI000A37176B|nr:MULTISPECIES: hypothetical protein [Enterobacteriaceae]HBQ5717242.1 hypothetical protein [Klebsiella pneumoniae subsp. pneumoniae]HEM8799868.1 hypothetical protein [Klebsiella michiganensis]EIW8473853.1 hypothetical protein [Klebsiella pneumoniae]EIW9593713.1 hypothetical protein [Klebsiella pneumoniae]EIX9793129.1 hypothetical protein [Klebsiella pneumoniae]
MKCFWVFSVVLTLSFTAVAAEKNDNVTNVKPSTGRDLYLTCKGYQVKGSSVINIDKPSYLEGTGEQVEFAIITPSGTSDGLKVFFDSWGFSPFGLIESHVMQEHWSLVHVGGRASVNGDKIDYSFVDNQPQAGDGYQPKTGVFLYGCMTSDKRPSWVEKIYSRTGMFRGGIEG